MAPLSQLCFMAYQTFFEHVWFKIGAGFLPKSSRFDKVGWFSPPPWAFQTPQVKVSWFRITNYVNPFIENSHGSLTETRETDVSSGFSERGRHGVCSSSPWQVNSGEFHTFPSLFPAPSIWPGDKVNSLQLVTPPTILPGFSGFLRPQCTGMRMVPVQFLSPPFEEQLLVFIKCSLTCQELRWVLVWLCNLGMNCNLLVLLNFYL